ncbi:MAG TPA: hypothetical protein VFV49_11710 [Thermoanaerobaculia bacterium]|nr:hypothetical protein [Thermoanaerobaculia bacterium]
MSSFSFSRLADYFRAVTVLDATGDVKKQRAIAELLGLADAPRVESETRVEIDDATKIRESEVKPAGTPRAGSSSPGPTAPRHRRKRVAFTIESIPAGFVRRPAWLDDQEILEPPPDVLPRPRQPEPLLPRRSSRAILSTAMATRTETNQLDVHALLEGELRGEVPQSIPRRVVPSLARGIQVLVDRGPSAAPFDADQKLLIEQIRAVGGREMISVVALDPSRQFAAAAGDDEWSDYFTRYRPQPRVAVVLVTDFGIARVPFERTATTDEWLRFLARLRAGGNPVVAFVPFAPRRWPPLLRRYAAIVQWDRRTTVHSVRRALRRNLR